MTSIYHCTEKIELTVIGAWIATLLAALIGFGLLKKTVDFCW